MIDLGIEPRTYAVLRRRHNQLDQSTVIFDDKSKMRKVCKGGSDDKVEQEMRRGDRGAAYTETTYTVGMRAGYNIMLL